ncbi:hypothetical protein GE061_002937 [Apolygus lucorum]|uniref:Uncharacterized protein n=1 Tax=Apolygus lucorum TaxID=248454 RepID=A0A6A4JPZ1_APOLU|nr:hypothetical protein GE061_002937 [Apolygus lucorum]
MKRIRSNTTRMSTWSRRDFEFSESQADREFNCPEYKNNIADTKTAKGTKWQRNPNKKKLSRSNLTMSDETTSTRLFSGIEKFKENIKQMPEIHRKPKKCAPGCRRDQLAHEGLLQMIETGNPEPLNSVFFAVNPPSFKGDIGRQKKIGLYLRSFE